MIKKMALRFSFFKVPQHKRFEYKPRFWNPEKEEREEREERLKRIQQELGIVTKTSDGKPYVPNIKGSFRREFERNRKSNQGFGKFKIKSLIFVASVALFIVIFFFMVKMMPYLFPQDEDRLEYPQTEIFR